MRLLGHSQPPVWRHNWGHPLPSPTTSWLRECLLSFVVRASDVFRVDCRALKPNTSFPRCWHRQHSMRGMHHLWVLLLPFPRPINDFFPVYCKGLCPSLGFQPVAAQLAVSSSNNTSAMPQDVDDSDVNDCTPSTRSKGERKAQN